jgi:myb proto-oncogene protein
MPLANGFPNPFPKSSLPPAQEEYVLARMHSKIGNKWQVLAKYLPRRPENTVKNHCESPLQLHI